MNLAIASEFQFLEEMIVFVIKFSRKNLKVYYLAKSLIWVERWYVIYFLLVGCRNIILTFSFAR